MRRQPLRRRAASLIVLLALGGLVGAAPAGASGDGWTAGWTSELTATGLAPGAVATGTVRLANARSEAVEVRVGLRDLLDDDNGCLPQERLSPREDCGVSGELGTGELGDQLRLELEPTDGEPVYVGPLSDLEGGLSAPVVVPAGGTATLAVVLSLPGTSTNETMTDRVSFELVMRAGGVDGAVLGASAATGVPSQGAPAAGEDGALASVLPSTGAAVGAALLLGGVGLLGVGLALWERGRRGMRS